MRYGIFSDVHSNLEAFRVVLDYYEKERIDKFIFLGDIIGYGANPGECIYLLKNLNPISIVGNHDWAVIDRLGIDYFNTYAKEAIIWTKNKLSIEDSSYLNSLELIYEENSFMCVHGSLKQPEQFNYILGYGDADENFLRLKKQVLFVGHSHRMEVYCYKNDTVTYVLDAEFSLKPDERYIINVGSVGQPRDRDSRASLCIYDNDKERVILKRLTYNIKSAADKIIANGLPRILADRLYLGW